MSYQGKISEIQVSKKDLEEKVEALRTVKEAAEQPEKEAKERHLKAWEGNLRYENISCSIVCHEHCITVCTVCLNITYTSSTLKNIPNAKPLMCSLNSVKTRNTVCVCVCDQNH